MNLAVALGSLILADEPGDLFIELKLGLTKLA
jgi:hypothetical protein